MSDLGVTVGRSGDRHPKLLTSGLEGSVETSRWADTSASAQTASCADPAGPAGAAELAEVGRAVRALAGVVDREAGLASRPDLAAVIEESQGLINMLTAVQDVAITHVAAIEEEWDEDGLVVESRRVPGHVALDAPDVVAGALRVSHLQAQRRVVLAARLAAAGQSTVPHVAEGSDAVDGDDADGSEMTDSPDADTDGTDAGGTDADAEDTLAAPSGLAGVHSAMRDGRLDGYAAAVLADELAEAPSEVARAVVVGLEGWFGRECASVLRRRCRRALAKVSPDLLRQRAVRARSECGLRRWAEEPGVDRWSGSFPSERAALGWAAVDALARQYVADGSCGHLEQARGKALIDLVTGNANIDVTVVITTAEDSDPTNPASPTDPTNSANSASPAIPTNPASPASLARPASAANMAGGVSPAGGVGSTAPEYAPAAAPRRKGLAADDHRSCTHREDHGDDRPSRSARSAPHESRAGDLVEAFGPFAGDPMLVRRDWLTELLSSSGKVRFARCHPRTGALLDGGTAHPKPQYSPAAAASQVSPAAAASQSSPLASTGSPGAAVYRPGKQLAALVRSRDGRCRFPGCSVAARFCDVDHVRPWPTGPTTAANLMCLCRRHHRIKQRPGWSVRLDVDGTTSWTDPVGRHLVTWPRNHLDLLSLPAAATLPAAVTLSADPSPPAVATGSATEVSILETVFEVLSDGYPPATTADHPTSPTPRRWRGDLVPPRPGRSCLTYPRRRDDDPHHHSHAGPLVAAERIEMEPPPF